jgi:hypothetical protein
MKRHIDESLAAWARETDHLSLLLRGARQVGKTYSVRALGKQFESFVEINFEFDSTVHRFFEGSLNPEEICRKLSVYAKTPIVPGKTLLFFDEIQAFPPALHSLRFFYERMPKLHVIAAGSLLELAIAEIPSMGVGRITSLFMYPMSFEELLWALGEELLAQQIGSASSAHPLDPVFHKRCLDIMRVHMMIGGLPAVVEGYRTTGDILASQKRIEGILVLLQDDFATYKRRVPASRLAETFHSVARQSGGKFVFARVAQGAPAAPYRESLLLLSQAHLVRVAMHTSARGLPLGGDIDERKQKAFLFDAGLHQRTLGLDLSSQVVRSDIQLITEGSLAEVYAGIELTTGMPSHMRPQLYYWHRESRGGNAEVDYIISRNDTVVPIEVKAGTRGAMQSLRLFLSEGRAPRGIRLSQENFGSYEGIDTIPLYAAGWLGRRDSARLP